MQGLQIIFRHKTVFEDYLKGLMFCATLCGKPWPRAMETFWSLLDKEVIQYKGCSKNTFSLMGPAAQWSFPSPYSYAIYKDANIFS